MRDDAISFIDDKHGRRRRVFVCWIEHDWPRYKEKEHHRNVIETNRTDSQSKWFVKKKKSQPKWTNLIWSAVIHSGHSHYKNFFVYSTVSGQMCTLIWVNRICVIWWYGAVLSCVVLSRRQMEKKNELYKYSPNQDACSFVRAIGSVWLVNVWNVIAGNPKPMPDDRTDTFARTLMRICNERKRENELWRLSNWFCFFFFFCWICFCMESKYSDSLSRAS